MAEFADLSEIINRMTGGNSGTPENIFVWIDNRIDGAAANGTVAGKWTSLWRYNQTKGGSGVVPTTAVAPTNLTRGALMQFDATGGRDKWLLGNGLISSAAGAVLFYDRLLHRGSLSGTALTAQTVGGAITRNTGGDGNQIWVEIYTAIGTTGTTITASYTNQDGISGQITKPVSIGATGNREAERLLPLPLQDGDTGVRSVETVTLAASTGTVGNFGIIIVRPIAVGMVPGAGTGYWRDYISGLPGLPKIDPGACLALAFLANGTSAPQMMFAAGFAEK